MRKIYVTTREHLETYCRGLLEQYPNNAAMPEFGLHFEINDGQRTAKQNRAIHVFFKLLADALNDAGLDMVAVLKKGADIPWTADSVKERLWKPVQEAAIGEVSTTKMDRSQVSHVYEILTRHLGQKFGVSVPFPQRDYG